MALTKQQALKFLVKLYNVADPKGLNAKRIKRDFDNMSDKDFEKYMKLLSEGKHSLYIEAPNMKNNLQVKDLVAGCDMLGLEIFHRIWIPDPATGKTFLTKHKYPVYRLPVRRMQQFLDKKLSVAESDTQIDGLTGQITGKDDPASITGPEIRVMHARGLDNTLKEMISVRGGNIGAYGDFKHQLEETGDASLGDIQTDSVSRTAMVTQVILESMHLDNNLVDGVL